MQNLLFLFKNLTSAEKIIKHLLTEDIEFNFKIVSSMEQLILEFENFKPEIIFTDHLIKKEEYLSIQEKTDSLNIISELIIISEKPNHDEEIDCLNLGVFDYIPLSYKKKIYISYKRAIELIKLKKESLPTNTKDNKDIFYKVLIEQAPDAIFRGNELGEFTEVNTAACLLTGYSREDLVSLKMSDLFSNEELNKKPLRFDLIKNGTTIINERFLITKNGSKIPVVMNTKLIHDNAYFCIMNDLSEHYNARKELKDKEERMRNIIEHSSNLFYSHNPDGQFTYVSQQIKEFLGYEPKQFIDLRSFVMSDNPINIENEKHTQIALTTGKAQAPFELELVAKNGQKIWVEVHEKPVIKNGNVTGIAGALIDITESKKALDQLKSSEEKFKTLFSEAPEGIFLADENNIIIDCNKAFCNLIEDSKNNILNTPIRKHIDNVDLIKVKNKLHTLQQDGKVDGEMRLITRKNKILTTFQNANALYNDDGKYIGAIVHIHDITKQKKIQEEIIVSEARLRAIFNASDNVAFILSEIKDGQHNICEFSPGAETIFGYSREEAIGKPRSIIHTEENKIKLPDYIHKLESGTNSIKEKIEMLKKSGEKFNSLHTGYPLINRKGNVSQLLSVTVDITNITEIENELKIREEQLTTLINASPDIICIKDEKGRWLMANNAIISRLNLKDIDFVNKSNSELASLNLISNKFYTSFSTTDELAWKNKEITVIEQQISTSDGLTYDYEIIKVPVFHSNGDRKVLVILGRDNTQRKILESQLQHSQKMEAIGLMASGIAHNFNNILQAIIGYVDFAKEGLETTSQRYQDIEQIGQHVKRATVLTRNLLAVGKEQYMNKNEVDINDIIRPIVELTNRNTINKISVSFNACENLPNLVADGSQLDQVIMNLFINASDAMPGGGKIEVDTSYIILDNEFCASNAWAKAGRYIKISISDTGFGMDEDTIRRIFEPFFTTKDLDKGTGLGLSTAFGIISQHKGLVNVISELHLGTTFEIFLPVIE